MRPAGDCRGVGRSDGATIVLCDGEILTPGADVLDRARGRHGYGGCRRGGADEEPDITDSSERRSHTYLEFVGGSAAKFYAAVVERGPADQWVVAFNFGRIGFPREWALKTDGVSEEDARRVYADLLSEKRRKGYEPRAWPAYLALPSGERPAAEPDTTLRSSRGIYRSTATGRLPPGIADLPPGHLLSPMPEDGPRGEGPVMWISDAPVINVTERWRQLAQAFAGSGLWPLIVDPSSVGIDRMGEILMDIPRPTGTDPFQLLRRWWHESSGIEEGEFDEEAFSPFGRKFPGMAERTPGDRPASIESHVQVMEGHLGIVAVDRPSRTLDAVGWMGGANYDMNPAEQSAILDTWEDRFDAYLVGLGFDMVTLAVGRPPGDLRAATLVAAEHLAFCSDNIFQGVGSINAYAPLLVGTHRWDFWWD